MAKMTLQTKLQQPQRCKEDPSNTSNNVGKQQSRSVSVSTAHSKRGEYSPSWATDSLRKHIKTTQRKREIPTFDSHSGHDFAGQRMTWENLEIPVREDEKRGRIPLRENA